MDRLPADASRALEQAAVLGREVPLVLLAELMQMPPDTLAGTLAPLISGEFLYEHGRATVVWKHALIQDVVYDRLTPAERVRLHAAVGRTLESRYAGRPEEGLDKLAHHRGRTDDRVRAVHYLSRLSVRMFPRYAISEVIETLMTALAHAEAMSGAVERDRAVAALVWRLGLPMIMAGRLREAVGVLERHQASVERMADPLISGPYYFCLAYAHNQRGNRDPALRCVERALAEGAAGRAIRWERAAPITSWRSRRSGEASSAVAPSTRGGRSSAWPVSPSRGSGLPRTGSAR